MQARLIAERDETPGKAGAFPGERPLSQPDPLATFLPMATL